MIKHNSSTIQHNGWFYLKVKSRKHYSFLINVEVKKYGLSKWILKRLYDSTKISVDKKLQENIMYVNAWQFFYRLNNLLSL